MVIVDPAVSPTYVDNSFADCTISNLTATGTDAASAAPVIRYCSHTIIILSTTGSSQGIILPSSAMIGDIIEFHPTYGLSAATYLYPPSGGTINAGPSVNVGASPNLMVRCVAPSTWYFMGQPW